MRDKNGRHHDDPKYMPDAATLEAAKAEIQAGWSETEERKRRGAGSGAVHIYSPSRINFRRVMEERR